MTGPAALGLIGAITRLAVAALAAAGGAAAASEAVATLYAPILAALTALG